MDAESKAEDSRRELLALLGPLPPRTGSVVAEVQSRERRGWYYLEKLLLHLNGREPVPAYYASPADQVPPFPAVLYHHAHGGEYGIGKQELIAGRSGMQPRPYAEELTDMGMSVLCIDAWNFGERHNRTESSLFKEMLWRGEVLWGWMMHDALRAFDYLCQRPDVDPSRVATLGMSMGSTTSWWIAALEERVSVCVDLCCLTEFDALVNDGALDRHGLYYYVPGLLPSFSAADINALIAPRPHLSLAGLNDPLTPAAGLQRIDQVLQRVYESKGAPDAWKLMTEDVGHEETPAMRAAVLRWLERYLVDGHA